MNKTQCLRRELLSLNKVCISAPSASTIIRKWILFLSEELECCVWWPEKDKVRFNLPKAFQNHLYKDVCCIIDCTEVYIERPRN